MGSPDEHGPGFAVIDVETTGFSPEDERIVEVGVVVLDPTGRETGAFCTLVDPGCDPGPTHIHGITAEMLAGAPTFAAIHPYLADRLSGRVVVATTSTTSTSASSGPSAAGPAGQGPGARPLASVDTLAVAQAHLGLQGRARLVEC